MKVKSAALKGNIAIDVRAAGKPYMSAINPAKIGAKKDTLMLAP